MNFIYTARENFLGESDTLVLNDVAKAAATFRLFELEKSSRLTTFALADLARIHAVLSQDIHPWTGELRSTELMEMDLPLCRVQFIEGEIDRVMLSIQSNPPSEVDPESAAETVAEYWSELTLIHPFPGGNSRAHRYFFDQMLQYSGWTLDWTLIDPYKVEAACYVGAFTTDHTFLKNLLYNAMSRSSEIKDTGRIAAAETNSAGSYIEIFHDMMRFRLDTPGVPSP